MSCLGVHVSSGSRRGFGDYLKQCADAGAPVPVVFAVDQDVWPDVQKFSPETIVVYRTQHNAKGKAIGDGPGSMYRGDPVLVAREWMAEIMPMWAKNKAHYYAPLNEQDPATIEQFGWHNAFTIECMTIAEQNGYKLGLYAFSVGNPKELRGTSGEVIATPNDGWLALIPSLQRAKANDHILLLHEYGLEYGTLEASAPHGLALRYRNAYRFLDYFGATPPLIISEAAPGLNPGQAGWLEDLKWYDSKLMEDGIVIGCCVYQLGGAENIEKHLARLAAYISKTPTPAQRFYPVAPAEAASPEWRVVCDSLNVRSGPGVSFPVVGTLTENESVQLRGEMKEESCYLWQRLEGDPERWIATWIATVAVVDDGG